MPRMQYIDQLESLIEDGAPFDELEELIEQLPLDRESKSALWLYAFAGTDQPQRRRVVEEVILAYA